VRRFIGAFVGLEQPMGSKKEWKNIRDLMRAFQAGKLKSDKVIG
jgi:hypothetical protein